MRDPDATEHWTGIYEQQSTTDLSWFQATPPCRWSCSTRHIVRSDDAILDVGAGASVLVDHLVDRGFHDISVLDIAPPALQAAKRRLGAAAGKVEWMATDLLTWKPVRRYDVWHDRAVFHFLTDQKDRDRYVAVLREALAPDGRVILATFAADGPQRCYGLPVTRYTPADLADQFPAVSLGIAQAQGSGQNAPWLAWPALASSTPSRHLHLARPWPELCRHSILLGIRLASFRWLRQERASSRTSVHPICRSFLHMLRAQVQGQAGGGRYTHDHCCDERPVP